MRRLAVAIALTLLLVACGADDAPEAGSSPAGESPPPAGTASPTATAPGEQPATAPGDEPTTGTPGTAGTEAAGTDGDAGSGAPASPSADAWTRMGDAPQALTEVAAATLGGTLLTAGGLDGGGAAVATVLAYDPAFDHWETAPPLPAAVHHTALVSTGAELLQIGGYAGSGFDQPTAAVHRFDPASGAWEEHAPLPEPRAAGAAAWDGARVVYAGGVGPDGLAGDVYALDVEAARWTRLGTLGEPREHLAAASDGDGLVWFLAGRTGGLDTNLATAEVVSGDEVRHVGALPTARGGVAGFYHPGAGACAVGGEGPSATFTEVECIDADGAVTRLPDLTVPRHGLGAASLDGVVFTVLGGSQPGLAVSRVTEALQGRE